ncbi:MAG TPA: thioredoxin family protein [Acholeplasmataceae bacterium]|jgi:thiol-disulfide isomerase/thioredoxin|nr:thioredoxin family protein [Acholeplasmataceae bacterium]
MYKKIFISILLILFLSACNKQPEPVKLPSSAYSLTELREFADFQNLEEKIKSNEAFVLFVYTKHCSACMSFEEVLREFIEERKLTIFSIENSVIPKDTWLDKEVGLVPTVLIIENKKTLAQLDPNKGEHKQYFETVTGFASWFDRYILKE